MTTDRSTLYRLHFDPTQDTDEQFRGRVEAAMADRAGDALVFCASLVADPEDWRKHPNPRVLFDNCSPVELARTAHLVLATAACELDRCQAAGAMPAALCQALKDRIRRALEALAVLPVEDLELKEIDPTIQGTA